jgi:hypothetical protein
MITATIVDPLIPSPTITLDLQAIPHDLPKRSHTWIINDTSGHALGEVNIPSVDAVTIDAEPGISVEHPDPAGRIHLHKRTDKIAAADPTRIVSSAVGDCVDPATINAASSSLNVFNTVRLKIPDGLPSSEVRGDIQNAVPESPRDDDPVVQTRTLVWAPGNAPSVTFAGIRQKNFCMQLTSSQIRFAAAAEQAAPLVVPLRLSATTRKVYRATPAGKPAAPVAKGALPATGEFRSDVVQITPWEPLLDIDITLAEKVQVESMKAPIDKALYVECGPKKKKKPIRNGGTIAIDDDALRASAGSCELVLDYNWMAKQDVDPNVPNACDTIDAKEKRACDHLSLFGPQVLEVSVRRDGADESKTRWAVRAPEKGRKDRIALPAPLNDEKGSSVYTVSASVVTRSPIDLTTTPADGGGTSPAPVNAETNFKAFANPKGPFAVPWDVPLRVFATIPAQITGFRFPAAPRELKSSADSPSYQLLSPRTGLMLGVEPWDYNRGKNIFLGVRLLGGFHMLQTAEPNIVASFVAGPSFDLPLIDQPQIGTSVNIGLFYELDLRDRSSHFIVTTGFNILTLFGAAPGASGK